MEYETPKYYVPTKEGLVKPETIEKIMKPFEDTLNGMTKQEKIEYLCLKNEIDKEEVKNTWGIIRDVYMIASKIILEDKEFTESLTLEEKEKIKMSVDPYVKGQFFQEEQSDLNDTEKEENRHGQER